MRDFKLKRKKILHIIAFFAVVVLVLSGASVLLDPVRLGIRDEVSERERYNLSLLAEPEDTVDVIVLGDSESYTFFSPMELWETQGIAAYNGGQSGQRLPETYYSLKRMLKKQSPKLVIVETNMVFLQVGTMNEIGYAARETANYYFPVFKYHGLWKHMAEGIQTAYPPHYNGFELRTVVCPYTGGPYMEETDKAEKILGIRRHYLEKINSLCEKNGAKLLLVTAPSPLNHTTMRHNALEKFSNETGIPYVDLNEKTEEIGIDWATDTLDGGDHLNLSGARKVSAFMEKYLVEHYDLPDHRGEDTYKPWDTRLEEYKKECSKF